jgi:hypothetical protein
MPRNQKGIAGVLVLTVLLIVGMLVGIYLVQNHTNLFPKASFKSSDPETSFTLESNKSSVKMGEEFKVNVLVSSDFEEANTFSALINYPSDKVSFVHIDPSTGSSTPSASVSPIPLSTSLFSASPSAQSMTYFIKKWIDQSVDDKKGTIALSGSVPNPGFKTTVGNKALMATDKLVNENFGSFNAAVKINRADKRFHGIG